MDVIIAILAVVFAAGCVGGLISGLFDAPWEKIDKDRESTAPPCEPTDTAPQPLEQHMELSLTVTYASLSDTSSRPSKQRMKILPYRNPNCNRLFPGLLMNIVLGGVAAIVIWGLYGQSAGVVIIGDDASHVSPSLTIGQLVDSLLIGMGGAGILLTLSNLRCDLVRKGRTEQPPSGQ